ncbi:hypothetical protein MRB53_009788 [Persea americana]|uniref:Uncharacterized protein n=1 Tax=Persea americana TaxID=3435 RepID=A0ACC2LQ28_PERAE|nr:hypothetical protein MRB53_009788 [Persea americana]
MDGDSKDGSRLRQFFVHGYGGGPVEKQMTPSLQSAGMGVTLKRKEPECRGNIDDALEKLQVGYEKLTAEIFRAAVGNLVNLKVYGTENFMEKMTL